MFRIRLEDLFATVPCGMVHTKRAGELGSLRCQPLVAFPYHFTRSVGDLSHYWGRVVAGKMELKIKILNIDDKRTPQQLIDWLKTGLRVFTDGRYELEVKDEGLPERERI